MKKTAKKVINTINRYFESLRVETNPVKLFIPLLIAFSAVLEIVYPITLYFIKTFWKHQTFEFPNPIYGIVVAFLFSTVLSLIISHTHRVELQETVS